MWLKKKKKKWLRVVGGGGVGQGKKVGGSCLDAAAIMGYIRLHNYIVSGVAAVNLGDSFFFSFHASLSILPQKQGACCLPLFSLPWSALGKILH